MFSYVVNTDREDACAYVCLTIEGLTAPTDLCLAEYVHVVLQPDFRQVVGRELKYSGDASSLMCIRP